MATERVPEPLLNGRGCKHLSISLIHPYTPHHTPAPTQDTAQSSDEWDSSDDETERGKVTYYFNGAARTVDVSMATVKFPTLSALSQAIK